MKQTSKDSKLVVQGLLGFLSDSGKTGLLSSVTDLLGEVVDKTKSAEEIIVTSQVTLTKEELGKIRQLVSHFLRRDIPAVNKVEKNLIGGFTIRVGDFFLDASLASELSNVKRLILS